MRSASRSCHAGVQFFQASATTLPMVIVLLKKENRCFRFVSKQNKKKVKKKKIGIHFIISFQYFINILVITVKAGWVFPLFSLLFMKVH